MFDWKEFLLTVLNTILGYGEGLIPAAVVAFLVERLTTWLPVLRPFREAIKQWLLARIAEWQLARAQAVVLGTAQEYLAGIKALQQGKPVTIDPAAEQALKAKRNQDAVARVVKEGIAAPADAQMLIERAIGSLRAEGKEV